MCARRDLVVSSSRQMDARRAPRPFRGEGRALSSGRPKCAFLLAPLFLFGSAPLRFASLFKSLVAALPAWRLGLELRASCSAVMLWCARRDLWPHRERTQRRAAKETNSSNESLGPKSLLAGRNWDAPAEAASPIEVAASRRRCCGAQGGT